MGDSEEELAVVVGAPLGAHRQEVVDTERYVSATDAAWEGVTEHLRAGAL
ncbi:hypothetical protein GCM10019016_013130 [Streptomyces prasinosporus]|uniref:Uncharacterized protein n=1 Tax=Streptomyces prasinosporus TaxID=68256 RepID=A0ABP6THE8_9ACTN